MALADESSGDVLHDLTGFQRDLLFALAGNGPTKGADVKRVLEAKYSQEINHGRLYPNLNELARKGLSSKSPGVDNRSKTYELTERGRSRIRSRTEWQLECIEGSHD